MRVGARTGRSTWVAMGPLGWMFVGPFILCFWMTYWMIWGPIKLTIMAVRAARKQSKHQEATPNWTR